MGIAGSSNEVKPDVGPSTPPRRSLGLALAASAISLLLAVAAAIGPAATSHTVATWSPRTGNDTSASGRLPVYGELLLSRHHPERLTVTLPCEDLRKASGSSTTLLATARDPSKWDGLRLATNDDLITVDVGRDRLASVSKDEFVPSPGDPCIVELTFDDGSWRLSRSGTTVARGRSAAPKVSGFFSESRSAPGADGMGLVARVEAAPEDSSPTGRQIALTVAAALSGLVAVLLLLRSTRPPDSIGGRNRFRSFASAISWIDLTVLGALGLWWVIGPNIFDDAWFMAIVENRRASGTFSSYFEVFNAAAPLGFAHQITLSLVAGVSDSFLWMRLPSLVFGIASWGVCRSYLGQVRSAGRGRATGICLATAAVVFLTGWFSWNMTVRPEPMVAFLAVLALAAMSRFWVAGSVWGLTMASLGATLALSIHPAGLVAVAPMLVAAPALVRWLRSRGADAWLTLGSLSLISIAVFVLLAFADSDVGLWRSAYGLLSDDPRHPGGLLTGDSAVHPAHGGRVRHTPSPSQHRCRIPRSRPLPDSP